LKLKNIDLLFLIFFILITLLSIDFLINSNHRQIIENVSKYEPFQNLATGLLITFWVCLIGNLLPIPTPYSWVVCYSSLPFLEKNIFIPLLVGFVASLGCLVGELGGYILGRSSANLIADERKEKLKYLQALLVKHPKLAPVFIFLFGLTPLNDDLLIIPLGLIKYDAKKTIIFCWLGKLGMMLIFAYNLFNICNLIGGESWILSIMSLYLLLIIIYLMLKIDIFKLDSKQEEAIEKMRISNN
jgi:membrane protein YqaA with SNARE-associated domain